MRNLIAANWGHDASLCFWNDVAKTFHTIEIEKLVGIKHYRGHARKDEELEILKRCAKIAEEEFGIPNDYHCIIRGNLLNDIKKEQIENGTGRLTDNKVSDDMMLDVDNINAAFNTKNIDITYRHHEAHAWNGFAPSGFDKAVILTMDGGGNDGFTHLFTAEHPNKPLTSRTRIHGVQAHGRNYTQACLWSLYSIMQSTDCSLDVAGKAMGASSYGNTESDAYSTATKLFMRSVSAWNNFSPGRMLYEKHYNQTLKDGTNSKIKFIEAFSTSPEVYNPYKLFIDEIDWQTECDMARGIQDAFVKDAIKWFKEIMSVRNINLDDYDRNVVFSGGSALNVLFNDILQRELNINLFVPPNPADQGIPYGMLVQWMVDHATQYSREETTYSGQKIQDMEDLQKYYHSHKGRMTTIADVASILKDDKIVGLVQGGMEVGARALGNRSILADPKGADKKDKVNVVKRREAYRPFAPVCRLEDVETYFDSVRYDNLSYMNFAIKTREEHIDKLRAVTHVDGTARVQTVTKEQNTILHDLLSEFDGVLLNTSFNVKGSPILNTLKEAFYMLDETTLDHLVVVDEHNTIWIF